MKARKKNQGYFKFLKRENIKEKYNMPETTENIDRKELIFLDRADQLIAVSCGFLDVFAVQCHEDKIESKLYPLGRITAGKALFTFKLDSLSLPLVDVDSGDQRKCRIVAMPGKEAVFENKGLPEAEQLSGLLESVIDWSNIMLKTYHSDSTYERFNMRILGRNEKVAVTKDDIISSDELLWLEQGNTANFADEMSGNVLIDKSTMIPVSSKRYLKCTDEGTVFPRTTEELIKISGISPLRKLLTDVYSNLPVFFKCRESETEKKIDFLEYQKETAFDYAIGKALSSAVARLSFRISWTRIPVRKCMSPAKSLIISSRSMERGSRRPQSAGVRSRPWPW